MEYRRKPGRNSVQKPRGRNRGGFRLRFSLQGRSPPNRIPARKPGRNSAQHPRDGSRGVSVGRRRCFSLQGRSPPNRIRAKTAELLSQHKEYGRKLGRNSVQKPRDGTVRRTHRTEQCAEPAGRNSAQHPRDGTAGVSRLRFPLQGRSPPNRIPAKTAELLSQLKEYRRKPGRNSVQKPRDGSRGVSVGASRYKVWLRFVRIARSASRSRATCDAMSPRCT